MRVGEGKSEALHEKCLDRIEGCEGLVKNCGGGCDTVEEVLDLFDLCEHGSDGNWRGALPHRG